MLRCGAKRGQKITCLVFSILLVRKHNTELRKVSTTVLLEYLSLKIPYHIAIFTYVRAIY